MQHVEDSAKPRRVKARGYTPQEVRVGLRQCLIAWFFGASFTAITSGTVFIAFLTKYLKISDFNYSLILSSGSAAVLLQVLGSYIVERTGCTKKIFLICATLHRLLWLAIAAVPLLIPSIHQQSSVVQVLFVGLVYFLSASLANFGAAGWTAWMADIVPRSIAGTFFGVRASFGLFIMSGVGLAVAYVADMSAHLHHTSTMYTLVFGVAAVLGATDILLFLPVREIARPVEVPRPSLLDIVKTPWTSALFRSFCLYTTVSTIGYGIMGAFQTPFAFACGMSVLSATFMLSVIPQISMAVLSPYWGKAIDRFGPKPVLAASALCHIVLPIWWIVLRPGLLWTLPILSIVTGLTWPGIDQVNMYMQLKGFPENRRSAFIAMFVVVFALASMVGTLLGGTLATFSAQHLRQISYLPHWVSHYQPLFALSVLIRLAAFVFILPRMPLAECGSKRDVAHAIAEDMVKSLPRGLRPSGKVKSEK